MVSYRKACGRSRENGAAGELQKLGIGKKFAKIDPSESILYHTERKGHYNP
jgi:hypothetical protein